MKYLATVSLIAIVALLGILLRHETASETYRNEKAELRSGRVGSGTKSPADSPRPSTVNDRRIQLNDENSVSAAIAAGAKLAEGQSAESSTTESNSVKDKFIVEEGTSLPPDTFANVFTKNWVETWFKGSCSSSRAGMEKECLFGPASAVATGPSAEEDAWTDEAIEATTKAADAAMQSRKGSDFRVRCNKSGCLLVFATPISQPSVKGEDLPGFYEFFSEGERIHWTACIGCSNASIEIWLVVRDPPVRK